MPLPADVGEAIASYLQHGRPATASRSVFVRLRAPLRGITAQGVSDIVVRASKRAGLPSVSAHRLRHSAATAMLRAGASPAPPRQPLRQPAPAPPAIYPTAHPAPLPPL